MQNLLTVNKYPQAQVDGIAIMGLKDRCEQDGTIQFS